MARAANVGEKTFQGLWIGHAPVRLMAATLFVSICIAGCFGGGKNACKKPQEYQSSQKAPPLELPDDLDEPDRAGELAIPDAAAQQEQSSEDRPCLERPPDYFDRKL